MRSSWEIEHRPKNLNEKKKISSSFHESHKIYLFRIYTILHNFSFETFFFTHYVYIYFLLSDLQFPSIRFFYDEYLFTSKWIQWRCRYVVATSGSDR